MRKQGKTGGIVPEIKKSDQWKDDMNSFNADMECLLDIFCEDVDAR